MDLHIIATMSQNYFHTAVNQWFNQTFAQPTGVQRQAWPAIKAKQHALIAAPARRASLCLERGRRPSDVKGMAGAPFCAMTALQL